MGRIFLVLAVLALGAAANPTLRAKAAPHAQFALDPVYDWQVRMRLRDIVTELEAHAASGRPLPGNSELSYFLEQRYAGEDAALDPWGIPYFLKSRGTELRVVSAGRDGKRGTPDDVLSEAIVRPKKR